MNERIKRIDRIVSEARKKINLKKRQLSFDTYPKELQDYLTRSGSNPYGRNLIEHRDFIIKAQ